MKPVVLCILDGWGQREDAMDNAITQADTPFWDKLVENNPKSLLKTSGLAVGLPEGQMGNSEVGHMNIGSGRVVMQSLPMIDSAFADGSFAKKEAVVEFIADLKKSGGDCHLFGMVSPGGVHSHQKHMAEFIKIVAAEGIKVKVHAILDGRDVAPESAIAYVKQFEKDIEPYANTSIATVTGRYYAMDRDNRWERVEPVYEATANANGTKAQSAEAAINSSYKNNIYDEFIKPCVIEGYEGMKDGDGFVMANFRADRARQILHVFLDDKFDGFNRSRTVKFVSALGFVEYSKALNKFINTVFPPTVLKNILGEVIADNKLKQLRISETEKYAHVTFFFNGGKEDEFDGEQRILIPSPKVSTYDLKPDMSAFEVTEKLVDAIKSAEFDLIVVNYANTDMVGHTGNKEAAIKAVEAIDTCLSKLVPSVEAAGGVIFITADHGNSEQMKDEETGQPHTSHTTNPVPFILAGKDVSGYNLKDGSLCDIAPTILKIMGIEQPKEMTGEALI